MSADHDLVYVSIAELSDRIRTKDISPVEVVRATLDRIDRLEPQLNAYNTVFADQAVAEARQAEADIGRGDYRGPLHGIPIGIKDIYECGPTTCGSESLADYVDGFGIDRERFLTAVRSPRVARVVAENDQAFRDSSLVSVPSLTVAGKYVINMDIGRKQALDVADRLVRKELESRSAQGAAAEAG